MRISDAFPSNFIKASDLRGQDVQVVISNVTMEDIGGDHKPVLHFQGKERGMVLNKTNSNVITDVYGDETNEWIGKPITIYPTRTDFQGKMVDAIRVRYPNDVPPQQQQRTQEPSRDVNQGNGNPNTTDAPFSDNIPF